jgi:Leucine-rich repeat (LRR) protein
LQEFFISSKGQEWSNSSLWGAQFEDPCTWYGVKCDKKQVVELNLANNGLGGFLSSSIGNLSSLKMLDINDNNIKGSIPKELFALSNLTHLRLRLVYIIPLLPSFVTYHAHVTYAL